MKQSLLEWEEATAVLVVRYGNTSHRERVLDGDLIVVGRGRGCDLTLEGSDIADVHCILIRTAAGWTIRDCGSRIGTRLNGLAIKEVPLSDSDLLQIGTFLFEVQLPPEPDASRPLGPKEERRLRRSRRRLARLALSLRRQLREEQARVAEFETRAAEVNRLADELRARLRSCDPPR